MTALLFISTLFIYREVVNFLMIQKLTDKLMSRNFYDYKVSHSLGKPKESRGKIVQEPDIHEDLNYIA